MLQPSLRTATGMLLVILLAGAVALGCAADKQDTPLIFAAASLADVLTDARAKYKAEVGRDVAFNFGGSTALANQVGRLDAPADAVILAGEGPFRVLLEQGRVDPGSVKVAARNSLVVVAAASLQLDSLDSLKDPDSRIAIADPELAPAGDYARQALIAAGIWNDLEEIIPTVDVRAALAAVSSGSADFAIVYATDAQTEPSVEVVLSVDEELHSPIIYPAAVVSDAPASAAAQAFLDFLLGDSGQQIFTEHGFLAVTTDGE